MRLHVRLRDGFQNDTVTIRVNDQEVYRRSGLRTNLAISVADVVEIPVEEATVRLDVAVEGGPLATEEIRVGETPFVDVSVKDGAVELRASAEGIPML